MDDEDEEEEEDRINNEYVQQDEEEEEVCEDYLKLILIFCFILILSCFLSFYTSFLCLLSALKGSDLGLDEDADGGKKYLPLLLSTPSLCSCEDVRYDMNRRTRSYIH